MASPPVLCLPFFSQGLLVPVWVACVVWFLIVPDVVLSHTACWLSFGFEVPPLRVTSTRAPVQSTHRQQPCTANHHSQHSAVLPPYGSYRLAFLRPQPRAISHHTANEPQLNCNYYTGESVAADTSTPLARLHEIIHSAVGQW